MQKQLRIITSRRIAICPFEASLSPVPSPVPAIAFSKHLRRLPVCFNPLPGVLNYYLHPSGWLVWCYPSGRRQLRALPF